LLVKEKRRNVQIILIYLKKKKQILYDTPIEHRYPKNDILKTFPGCSCAVWTHKACLSSSDLNN